MNSNASSSEGCAATQSAAVLDLSDRAHVEIHGRDRQAFLHNFCTNDIKRLRPGDGCEAFIPSIKGRILGHVFVFCEEDRLLLDSVPGSDAFLMQHLDRYVITEDVTLQNRTADLGDLLVAGPQAGRIVSESLGVGVDDLPMYGHRSAAFDSEAVIVARVPITNDPGFLLIAPSATISSLSNALLARGAVSAGRELFDALRIEAGFPLYGVDLSEDMLAQEAGRTQQAISFTKGCYLGQEPIARLDSLGHANRMLRGLRLDSGAAPPAGASVLDESGQETIGIISSAAVSPDDGRPVALVLLKFKHGTPGTRVVVQCDESTKVPATVFWHT
jgi:folate-binding protein YgfZ